MVFSSILFLFVYLPVVLAVYYIVPARYRNLWLFIVNLVFYGWGEPVYILLMVFSIALNYAAGLLIARYRLTDDKKARAVLTVNTVVNLALLIFFKYFDLLAATLSRIPGISIPALGLTLPIGISFYTFQTMSYPIDVYRKQAPVQKSVVSFGAYVTLFPQLIAGPIVRYKDIAEQLDHRQETADQFALGVQRFVAGLAKKVLLANSIGALWDTISALPASEMSVAAAWLGIIAFAFQIYFDFSGYSDMAIGIALLLGFHFNINFDSPYKSASITEFWRRWHISLSSWLRDYLYISLGGNRKGKIRQYANLIITMFLGGLWHGASWNFVLWGMMHGVALAAHKFWMTLTGRKKGTESHGIHRFFGVLVTFHFVCFCWIFFRNAEFSTSMDMLKQIFTTFRPQLFPQLVEGYWEVFALMALGYLLHFVPDSWERACTKTVIRLPLLGKAVLMLAVIYLVIQMKSSEIQPFIYFQF